MVTKVLVCGGGNAAHVLTTILGSKPDQFQVNVLTLWSDEAERWSNIVQGNDGNITADLKEEGKSIQGKPNIITKDPKKAVPGCEWMILALPSTLHNMYIELIEPFLEDGKAITICALSPHGGFDLGVRHILGSKMKDVTLVGTYELPWACRIESFGERVTILGTKKTMELIVVPPSGADAKAFTGTQNTLQDILGPLPKLECDPSVTFLPLMLDGFWHGAIMYGEFKDWDGKTPFLEKPLFYQGVSDETGKLMVDISDECMAIKAKLEGRFPGLNLSYISDTQDWFLSAYGDMIKDKEHGFGAMLRTNSAYDGLTHPMKPAPDGQKGFVPDFGHRYMVEDLYMGIINIKSMGELAQVPTPNTDIVIEWCQKVSGKTVMVDGKLGGKDLDKTRTPQRYGCTNFDVFMKENNYTTNAA